jgi:hypothetical protein
VTSSENKQQSFESQREKCPIHAAFLIAHASSTVHISPR